MRYDDSMNYTDHTNEISTKKTGFSAVSLARAALGVAFISVCSVIAIPIGAIPITFSLFAIMAVALLLTPAETLLAVLAYIAIGALGVPVFSGGGSGLGVITGPTGGFLLTYPLMTSMISAFRVIYDKKKLKNNLKFTTYSFIACISTLPFCYFFGTLQFVSYAHVSIRYALTVCVLPFIIPDVFKAVLAVFLSERVRTRLNRSAS